MKTVLIALGSLVGVFVVGFVVLFAVTLKEGSDLEANCKLLNRDVRNTVRTSNGGVTQEPARRKYLCPDGKVHWY